MPYELNDDVPAEGIPLPDYYELDPPRLARVQAAMQRRAAEAGLPYRAPEIVANTRKAHLLAEYAREQGRLGPVHKALFHAYFAEGWNLGDDDVLRRVAAAAGLEPDAALAAVRDPRYAQAHAANLERARGLGIAVVPTIVVAERHRIVGMKTYAELREALSQIAAGLV